MSVSYVRMENGEIAYEKTFSDEEVALAKEELLQITSDIFHSDDLEVLLEENTFMEFLILFDQIKDHAELKKWALDAYEFYTSTNANSTDLKPETTTGETEMTEKKTTDATVDAIYKAAEQEMKKPETIRAQEEAIKTVFGPKENEKPHTQAPVVTLKDEKAWVKNIGIFGLGAAAGAAGMWAYNHFFKD